MNTGMKVLLATSAVAILAAPVFADSDDVDVRALTRQIEALQARVSALEAARTFTSFMPNFAERFHVMHRAGEAGDWAVASHELSEMKRLSGASMSIDAEKGELMQAMMAPSLSALDEAIEHGDPRQFEQALVQSVASCNACHAATGSAFIEVTLNAREAISLRHPHKLSERGVPSGHSHAMPAGDTEMMHEQPDADMPHDDTVRPEHHD